MTTNSPSSESDPSVDTDTGTGADTGPETDAGSTVERVSPADPIATAARTDAETVVPPDTPVHRCAYCGRPFAEESYLVLHHGLAHAEALSAAEREAFEEAYGDEERELRRFRIVALGLLVLLYFGLLFTFAAVT